ncbi:WbqC family protein [Paraflavisolibacter sp. H34]|uniref:WbqC family protein n=1 Tax=Huijunlia imazamoxiresistens TaxID=3127457 RepID=UPI003019EEF4
MGGKKVAILQTNYIPWKGYFDLINSVDEFVLYDDMQYTKNDWRNRNKIKSPKGLHWLTIPVRQHSLSQKIRETQVADDSWGKKHWSTLKQFYSKAPYFKTYQPLFEELYLNCTTPYLSEINYRFISTINQVLHIPTKLTWSSDYTLLEGKTERLIDLIQQLDGKEYLSGPAAKDYIVPELFEQAGIRLTWMDYSGYPQYDQIHPPFEHGVSILDLIFNAGEKASTLMKSFSK